MDTTKLNLYLNKYPFLSTFIVKNQKLQYYIIQDVHVSDAVLSALCGDISIDRCDKVLDQVKILEKNYTHI